MPSLATWNDLAGFVWLGHLHSLEFSCYIQTCFSGRYTWLTFQVCITGNCSVMVRHARVPYIHRPGARCIAASTECEHLFGPPKKCFPNAKMPASLLNFKSFVRDIHDFVYIRHETNLVRCIWPMHGMRACWYEWSQLWASGLYHVVQDQDADLYSLIWWALETSAAWYWILLNMMYHL